MSDLATLLEPRVQRWKPAGPTAIITSSTGRDADVIAVPLDGTAAVTLATVHDLSGSVPAGAVFNIRADGAMLAISLADSITTRRVAVLDLTTGKAGWLSTPAIDETDWVPVWAPDGASLYFGRWDTHAGDRGVMHVALDGRLLPSISPTTTFAATSNVSRATAEGVLVGSDELNGSTVWALDLTTGTKRSFQQHNSWVIAWRSARPRALVSAWTEIAAPGAGYLALWDETTDQRTIIYPSPVGGADFDPSGTQIVAATVDPADARSRLRVMKTDGSSGRFIAGTEDARSVLWSASGIVYMTFPENAADELRVVAALGGASRVLYSASALRGLQLVGAP